MDHHYYLTIIGVSATLERTTEIGGRMKKIFVLCILLSCFIYISACSRPADTNNVISLKDTSTAENVSSNLSADTETPTANYQKYNGDWSSNGKSHEDIIKNGGTGFHVEIINDVVQ